MIKSILLGSVMVVAFSASAVAADIYAASKLGVASVQDTVLASTEGGATCTSPNGNAADLGTPGGVALCSSLGTATSGANHSVTNANPVTGANFLQVIGGPIGAP